MNSTVKLGCPCRGENINEDQRQNIKKALKFLFFLLVYEALQSAPERSFFIPKTCNIQILNKNESTAILCGKWISGKNYEHLRT